ncbi:MAG: helix-turn-helix domain-containing protein, partial [Pseudomonadota bacterium]|nr:helix-turn-helix domain-containing protein [Pseudomonadota bacterium]
ETGLLNGREATTSWWLEHQFKNLYPLVKLKARELLTEDDQLLCSGSMSASLNLATRVIDRFHSHAMAAQCAKVMLVNNNDQAQYQELITDIPSGDPVVAKCQYWLQTHLREKIDQPTLAQKMGTSQRTLIRKFKSELGVPPLTYLQNLRIETAKHLLESSTLALSEIIGRVGYTDISSFSRLFRQRTDLTPAAYRRRFRVA